MHMQLCNRFIYFFINFLFNVKIVDYGVKIDFLFRFLLNVKLNKKKKNYDIQFFFLQFLNFPPLF